MFTKQTAAMRGSCAQNVFQQTQCRCSYISYRKSVIQMVIVFKGQLRRKMNLWCNYTLLPSQPLSEIFFMIAECK